MDSKPKADPGRRRFLKTACSTGIGVVAGAAGLKNGRAWAAGEAPDRPSEMPMRNFGKTGVKIPILTFGGSMNLQSQPLLLRQALKMGVSYWDTADNYSGGRSESGIGDYFSKYPEDRKRVFLVTKTSAGTPERMTADLNASLERLRTDYVDLYLLHGLSGVAGEIDDDVRKWSDAAKSEGRIRFFGFSTHRNMADCLKEAAALGWIDGIMMTYNYRLMQDADMTSAIDACAASGIGLVAMKTQGRSLTLSGFGRGGDLVQRFLDRGLTKYQARLKAVWEDRRIAGICSHMDNLSILKENVAAAVDGVALTEDDRRALARYARETAAGYCAGCGHICESALGGSLPVTDVMRCLMYARSYNDYQMARDAYAALPPGTRLRLLETDFAAAEACCPQGIEIGRMMRRAAEDLG